MNAQNKPDNIHSPLLPPTKIFEDSNACLVLATSDTHFKPRIEHISLKFLHFQDQILNGTITIWKIGMYENLADIFEKPLGRSKFEYMRKLIMGW